MNSISRAPLVVKDMPLLIANKQLEGHIDAMRGYSLSTIIRVTGLQ